VLAGAQGEAPPPAPLLPTTTGRRLKDPVYGSLTRAIYEWGPKLRTFSNAQMAKAVGGATSSTFTALATIRRRGHVQKNRDMTWTWLLYEPEPDAGESGAV
jgi:hypothetical protein